MSKSAVVTQLTQQGADFSTLNHIFAVKPSKSLQIFSSYLPFSADWILPSPSQVLVALHFHCCTENRKARETDKHA